jgi:hypothetical protein
LNTHVENALLKDSGMESRTHYKSLRITNLKASNKPNFLIKSVVKNKQEKKGAIISLNYDYTIEVTKVLTIIKEYQVK